MAEQAIAQIAPNMAGQEAAVAGSQAVVFTATDRKIIEERSGKIDKNRSFLDALKEKPLTPEVENEETNIKPQTDVKELEGRQHNHRKMLKHATLFNPQDKSEINNKLPDKYEEAPMPQVEPVTPEKEQPVNPTEAFDKLAAEQDQLHSILHHIKELNLKRLLTNKASEFNALTKEIKTATLHSANTEAKDYLDAKLNKLTLSAAKYKLGILKSLQSMDHSQERKDAIHWLEKIITQLSKSS